MSNIDNFEIIEDRISRLERLVGNFEKIEETKGLETILNISNKITDYSTNSPKILTAFKSLNDIARYTSFDAVNEIEDSTFLKAKIELILSEEDNLRKLNNDFEKLRNLSKLLDNPTLNEVPRLMEKLKEISSKQASLKNDEADLKEDLNNFLSVYYSSMKSINEVLVNLNDYLEQFDNQTKSSD